MNSYNRYALCMTLLLACSLSAVPVVLANNPNGKTPNALHNNNLQSHIQKWQRDPDGTAQEYGDIRHWDLSNVTSMRNLFSFNEGFNEDITAWDVSRVTDFSFAFWGASNFDQNLGTWDVRKAQFMECMFCDAGKFRGEGLEMWSDRLGNVEVMSRMFSQSAIGEETDLSEWQVSSVTNFRDMFMDTPAYDQLLCWDVNYTAHALGMFNGSGACFDKKCALPHTLDEAGCSGAWSMMSSAASMWVMVTLTAVVSLASLV